MIFSKRSFLFFIALFVATTAAIPNVQASTTLFQETTPNGTVVKVNFYPKLLEFRLKLNGSPKCKNKITNHLPFLACTAGYLGADYYVKIYNAIKSKI